MTRKTPHLNEAEIAAWNPEPQPDPGEDKAARLMAKLEETGQWNPRQAAGRRWAMGCVALEITQRCNLDCTLCYLSRHSQSVPDPPLPMVMERIESIHRHYGAGTDVQITGGDPTLRKPEELLRIVSAIRGKGMRPSLFTNGIRATPMLLRALADHGLADVAFHVDLTQRRRGYRSEKELNQLRADYLQRARGLPLGVLFNTTIFAGNFAEIPDMVRFFRERASGISLVSFQLHADTGRSVLGARPGFITPRIVAEQISRGAGAEISFDFPVVGHSSCNRYSICLEAGGRLYNLLDANPFLEEMLERTGHLHFERERPWSAAGAVARVLLPHPRLWAPALGFVGKKLWEMREGLVRSRGRINRLSFFIHNFMDASALDPERCRACVFMVETGEGPLSMCLHNAKRDAYILPSRLAAGPAAD